VISVNHKAKEMKTQIHIGKMSKGFLLLLFLSAVSFGTFAQQSGKSKLDKNAASAVKVAWYDLDQLADNNEKELKYKAPAAETEFYSEKPIILAGSTQERNEMIGSASWNDNIVRVGYYEKEKTTVWYKIRSIFTDRSAENCQACTRIVATPYVLSKDM